MRAVPIYFWCPEAEVEPMPQPVEQFDARGYRRHLNPQLNCRFRVPGSDRILPQGRYGFWTDRLAQEYTGVRCSTHDHAAQIFRQQAAYERRTGAVINARYQQRFERLILPGDAERGHPDGRLRNFWVERRPDPITLTNIWRRS